MIDNNYNDKGITAESLPHFVLTLRHLCRVTVRSVLRNNGVNTTKEFLSVINSLGLPSIMRNYLRYLWLVDMWYFVHSFEWNNYIIMILYYLQFNKQHELVQKKYLKIIFLIKYYFTSLISHNCIYVHLTKMYKFYK